MILAFAGRRIDAPDAAKPRFPLANVALVRSRVRKLLEAQTATIVIASAACGVDLIVLTEAQALGLRRKVVLPFSRDQFRKTSVTDRPGDWGPIYDQVLDDAEAAGDLLALDEKLDDHAYIVVNQMILELTLASMNELHQPGAAVLVWDGTSSGDSDMTETFGIEARTRGLAVVEVPTI